MTETPDDLVEPETPETEPPPADPESEARDDEAPGLSAEKSLGLLPPE